MKIITGIPTQLIDQGEDVTLKVLLQDEDNNRRPLDLTNATEIVACLENADGTFLLVTLTSGDIVIVGSTLLGDFTVKLLTAGSDLLSIALEQTLTIKITRPGGTETHKLKKAYTVDAKTC